MVTRNLARRWHFAAGAFTFVLGLVLALPTRATADEGWAFHSPGTVGASAPGPSHGGSDAAGGAFRSPSADYNPAGAPGRLSTGGGSGKGFQAPKGAGGLASTAAGGCGAKPGGG